MKQFNVKKIAATIALGALALNFAGCASTPAQTTAAPSTDAETAQGSADVTTAHVSAD